MDNLLAGSYFLSFSDKSTKLAVSARFINGTTNMASEKFICVRKLEKLLQL